MEPSSLIRGLQHLVDILGEMNKPYCVGGGLAFSILVEPRATVDIDLFLLIDDNLMENLVDRLKGHFDAVIPREGIMRIADIQIKRIVLIADREDIIIDLVTAEKKLMTSMLSRCREVSAFGRHIPVISREDLYILKSRSTRTQDKADIERMDALLKDTLDTNYLAAWLDQ